MKEGRPETAEPDRYWIVARDKPGLLIALMRDLCGNAHISFEGDLSRCCFSSEIAISTVETAELSRATSVPKLDFVVLPLEPETVEPILNVVLPDRRLLEDIVHIQIEKNGRLEFGSYDRFHPECIVCFRGVRTALLDDLRDRGVIRSWTIPHEGASRWHG
jgi:hypothetical protein